MWPCKYSNTWFQKLSFDKFDGGKFVSNNS